jgi:F-type H+-transporting ATPase subunit b
VQVDWLTVAAQIVNFLALVWLLRRFLYRPVTEAMARREARIEVRLAEAKAAREAAKTEAQGVRDAQTALEARRETMLAEARREAEALRARLKDEIRAEMDAERRSWRAHLAEEREGFAERLRQRAGHQVIDIVGRVLRDYADRDLAAQAASAFASRLAALDDEERQRLADAAARSGAQAEVESGVALGTGVRSHVTRAVHDCVGRAIEVAYAEDEALLLGVRLTIGEQMVEWSAARFLDRLETTLDEVIEGAAPRRRADASAAG